MTHKNMIVVALGSFAIASLPLAFAHAQSGDALANAETTCLDHGVGPSSPAFNPCVTRVALAFDRGDVATAHAEAQRAADARSICLSYGLNPRTLGYRECVASNLDPVTVRAVRIAPYPAYSDGYGFYRDANGDLRDRNGELVRPAQSYAYLPN